MNDHGEDRAEPEPSYQPGLRNIPRPLLLVRCRRCRKTAGLWNENLNGQGHWKNRNDDQCRCQPQPELPVGDERRRLVAEALRRPPHPKGGARMTVSR